MLEINESECSTKYLIGILIKKPSMFKLLSIIDKKYSDWISSERSCFLSKKYGYTQLLDSGGYF